VLEAVVAGLIGSILGFAFLFISKIVVLDGRLQALTNVLTPIPNSNVWLMLPLLAGVGSVVSAVTAWVTLRFYLRV
jgi:cell division transport system permease protein